MKKKTKRMRKKKRVQIGDRVAIYVGSNKDSVIGIISGWRLHPGGYKNEYLCICPKRHSDESRERWFVEWQLTFIERLTNEQLLTYELEAVREFGKTRIAQCQ